MSCHQPSFRQNFLLNSLEGGGSVDTFAQAFEFASNQGLRVLNRN
jgi:hypothetical protein